MCLLLRQAYHSRLTHLAQGLLARVLDLGEEPRLILGKEGDERVTDVFGESGLNLAVCEQHVLPDFCDSRLTHLTLGERG